MHNCTLPAGLESHIEQHFSQFLQGDFQANEFSHQIHPKHYFFFFPSLASFFFPCFPFSYHRQDPLSPASSWQQRPSQMTVWGLPACRPPPPGHTPHNNRLHHGTRKGGSAAPSGTAARPSRCGLLGSPLRAPASGSAARLFELRESPLGHNSMDLLKY